ncbi:hypothetical protein MPH_13906, partial [Macrophomina phaseolina MS6]
MQDIKYERRIYKLQRLQGRTPTQALLDELKDDNEWFTAFELNSQQQLASLFAHETSLQALKRWHRVLLLDRTYKTDLYKMPLLHIVGVDCTGSNFTVGFCFLSREDEAAYSTAISFFKQALGSLTPGVFITDKERALKNALTAQFPTSTQLLCAWNVYNNIKGHAHKVWVIHGGQEPSVQDEQERLREDFLTRWKE